MSDLVHPSIRLNYLIVHNREPFIWLSFKSLFVWTNCLWKAIHFSVALRDHGVCFGERFYQIQPPICRWILRPLSTIQIEIIIPITRIHGILLVCATFRTLFTAYQKIFSWIDVRFRQNLGYKLFKKLAYLKQSWFIRNNGMLPLEK